MENGALASHWDSSGLNLRWDLSYGVYMFSSYMRGFLPNIPIS